MTATTRRYHGLDGLRGFAMLLGIVLHATLTYFSRDGGFEFFWPADDDQSALLFILFEFIHVWRMPTFFLVAGFFAALVLERRSGSVFVRDRLKRIGLPLVIFGGVMAGIMPLIWVYGWSGRLPEGVMTSIIGNLNPRADMVAHLWFLYYLLLIYAALLVFRQVLVRFSFLSHEALESALYSKVPLLLTMAVVVMLIVNDDESKRLWPVNAPDLLYGALFFFYGYGLYGRRALIDEFKGSMIIVLWLVAAVAFLGHIVLLETEGLLLLKASFYGASAVFFSVGFVGLSERFLRTPRPWIRWLADSSYWIYIMHFPVVTVLTFYLAHLDRGGWLRYLTGFSWPAELKFLVACVVTGALGVATYRYFVRYTPLGTLLNGKQEGASVSGSPPSDR
jgi:peptidoglycan/LPS O-acetylase OafA/YrhL